MRARTRGDATCRRPCVCRPNAALGSTCAPTRRADRPHAPVAQQARRCVVATQSPSPRAARLVLLRAVRCHRTTTSGDWRGTHPHHTCRGVLGAGDRTRAVQSHSTRPTVHPHQGCTSQPHECARRRPLPHRCASPRIPAHARCVRGLRPVHMRRCCCGATMPDQVQSKQRDQPAVCHVCWTCTR